MGKYACFVYEYFRGGIKTFCTTVKTRAPCAAAGTEQSLRVCENEIEKMITALFNSRACCSPVIMFSVLLTSG